MEQQIKNCQNCKSEFEIREEDFRFYEKIKVPPPTFCSECRMVRRMMFRNLKTLYKRKVEGIEKPVFAMIAPDSPFRVVDASKFYTGEFDTTQYGKDYDFNRPFFEQFKELMLKIPLPHIYFLNNINSEYTNNTVELKNCHLVFNSGFSENILYGIDVLQTNDSLDLDRVQNSELCYELSDSGKCNKVFFSSECGDSYSIYFSHNLINCHDCFLCANLSHKSYCILNKEYSKEEYFEKLKDFNFGSYGNIKKYRNELDELKLKFPVSCFHGHSNINVSGDYLEHCKNVHHSFNNQNLEDCAYCQYILFLPSKDSYDATVAGGELLYEIGEVVGYNLKFCWYNFGKKMDIKNGLRNMEYTIFSSNCSDLFGCIGLSNKQYCILNKQYSKEEYENLIPKIKKHMNDMPYVDEKGRVFKYGEFFPYDISPYAYNETLVQEIFPLTKDEALKKGYSWRDFEEKNYNITLKPGGLPDDIKDVSDNITKEIIGCEHDENCNCGCAKAFKIIEQELEFYKQNDLALPHLCPNCRHSERVKNRTSFKLYKRHCDCKGKISGNELYKNTSKHFHETNHCPNEFETTYSPERQEIVYCDACYQNEIY